MSSETAREPVELGRPGGRSQLVKSVERATNVVRVLAAHPYPMSVGEIARYMHLAPPSVHRLLRTMVGVGWIEQNSRTSRYRLGTEILAIGAAGLITSPIVQNARIHLKQLSESTGHRTFLSALVGSRVVYLAREMSSEQLSPSKVFEAGASLPAHTQPDGKVLMAYLEPAARAYLYDEPLRRYTAKTITDPKELERQLEVVRKQGYAVDRGERFEEYYSLAVPIMAHGDTPRLAMLAVVEGDITPEYEAQLSSQMLTLASEMAEQLLILGDIPTPSVPMAHFNLQ